MKRRELEIAIRAAAKIAHETEFILIGSQAVHAYCRRPPAEMLLSQECDLYFKNRPETANLLHTELGRGSDFAQEHGFYVDIVTPEIASLPDGWQRRLKPLQAGSIKVYCLEIHDLIVSKLAAGRLKDLEFAGAMLRLGLVDPKVVQHRIRQFPVAQDRPRLRSRLRIVLDELKHGE